MSDLSKVCSRLGDGAAPYVMGAQLDDLAGYWLEVNCCAGTTLMPFMLLARQRRTRPGNLSERLRDLLPRLRCKECGGSPKAAYLNETPNRNANHGAAPGWSVQLIPAPAAPAVRYAEAAE